jgi:hypothetical protein
MQEVYELKRGDLLSLGGTVDLAAGTWAATAQARTAKGTLVATLAVTLNPPVAPSTKHTILIESPTTGWPIADVLVDVRFHDTVTPTNAFHSETLIVRVGKEVTESA